MPAISRSRLVRAVATGFAFGVAVELMAILAAVASAGGGHGDYIAARALFPGPLLLAFLEGGRIGPLSLAAGLLQFPLYGGLLLWGFAQRHHLPGIAVALIHLLGVAVCFSGLVPNFTSAS